MKSFFKITILQTSKHPQLLISNTKWFTHKYSTQKKKTTCKTNPNKLRLLQENLKKNYNLFCKRRNQKPLLRLNTLALQISQLKS